MKIHKNTTKQLLLKDLESLGKILTQIRADVIDDNEVSLTALRYIIDDTARILVDVVEREALYES